MRVRNSAGWVLASNCSMYSFAGDVREPGILRRWTRTENCVGSGLHRIKASSSLRSSSSRRTERESSAIGLRSGNCVIIVKISFCGMWSARICLMRKSGNVRMSALMVTSCSDKSAGGASCFWKSIVSVGKGFAQYHLLWWMKSQTVEQ